MQCKVKASLLLNCHTRTADAARRGRAVLMMFTYSLGQSRSIWGLPSHVVLANLSNPCCKGVPISGAVPEGTGRGHMRTSYR